MRGWSDGSCCCRVLQPVDERLWCDVDDPAGEGAEVACNGTPGEAVVLLVCDPVGEWLAVAVFEECFGDAPVVAQVVPLLCPTGWTLQLGRQLRN